ncbi:uncharacterized protein [Nicotiana tomentosiformis]|uniref:uncharacterized protein n=1 Tax=Nicotiana tomentosiformis TaxID=4098 RepID=UPI00051ABF05|nr:putative uncharacterized protein DDB_G0282133 [Nicotiana tomentosiformis]
MVSLSLTSFMLVLLFIFLTLKVSIAHTDQAKQTLVVVHEAENGFTMELTRSHQSVEKEVLDGVPAAAVLSTNGRMDGRKMMAERRNMKKNMKQVEASIKTEEDSKNSGNSNGSASRLGNSRKKIHHQSCDESTVNKNSRNPANGCSNSGNSLNKLASTDQTDNSESFQKLESEKLLEDANEILNMMNKDYSGGPGSGSKPRHKPPINNYQTFHGSNP